VPSDHTIGVIGERCQNDLDQIQGYLLELF